MSGLGIIVIVLAGVAAFVGQGGLALVLAIVGISLVALPWLD